MAKKTFHRFDLTGGVNVITNPLVIKESEIEVGINTDSDVFGSITKKKGSRCYGGTPATTATRCDAIHHYKIAAGTTSEPLIVFYPTASGINKVIETTLDGAITTSTTTISLTDASSFASSGVIEIEGDRISYTGKSSNDLTGCTGISYTHADNVAVRQLSKIANSGAAGFDRFRFVNFLDKAVYTQYTEAAATFNAPLAYDTDLAGGNGNPLNLDDASAPANATVVEVFRSRLFFAGNSTYPDRLFASSIPSSTGNVTWDNATEIIDVIGSNGFYLDVNPKDGQNITALKRNGYELLIFKERAMYTWDGSSTQPDIIVDIGIPTQECITTIHGMSFFIGRSSKDFGIYAYSGGFPKRISKRIQKWVDAITSVSPSTNRDNIRLLNTVASDDKVYFYLGDYLVVDNTSHVNVWAVYTISQDRWDIWKSSQSNQGFMKVRAFGKVELIDETNKTPTKEIVLFSGTDGKIYEIENGATDDNGDTPKNIEIQVDTKEDFFGDPKNAKSLLEFYIYATEPGTSSIKYRYDRGEWYPLGKLSERFNLLKPKTKQKTTSGNTIQFQFSDYSDQTVQIDGWGVDLDMHTEPKRKNR